MLTIYLTNVSHDTSGIAYYEFNIEGTYTAGMELAQLILSVIDKSTSP